MIYWRRNRPAVGYPPYVYQHVLAFLPNFFGSITHRGGRDARVPVRRRYAVNLCGGGMPAFQSAPLRGKLMWYNKAGHPRSSPSPLRVNLMCFGLLKKIFLAVW
ncbi:MAG: hypothetical protein LBQ66_01625 [Planctomycetaceae bacterium]|nr:hypothetical protein [Planctomycetaceae bacterium]